jgi:hypothetical protein
MDLLVSFPGLCLGGRLITQQTHTYSQKTISGKKEKLVMNEVMLENIKRMVGLGCPIQVIQDWDLREGPGCPSNPNSWGGWGVRAEEGILVECWGFGDWDGRRGWGLEDLPKFLMVLGEYQPYGWVKGVKNYAVFLEKMKRFLEEKWVIHKIGKEGAMKLYERFVRLDPSYEPSYE